MSSWDSEQPSVAIVGAGISGLTCARELLDDGWRVVVFEKSRGLGGRMATRRGDDGLCFDHGAQYFIARDPCFQARVEGWLRDGVADVWAGRIVSLRRGKIGSDPSNKSRYVATPAMNAICKHLAKGVELRPNTRIGIPVRKGSHWLLFDEHGVDCGAFDFVVSSAPSAQSVELLQSAPRLAARARSVRTSGCWAVMAALAEPLICPFSGAFVEDSPLSWIADNGSKPGRRSGPPTWVLHASPEWSAVHLEAPAEFVEAALVDAFRRAIDRTLPELLHVQAHRWSYALPENPLPEPFLFDDRVKIGACGDWCGGPRVEGAFLSGLAIADRLREAARGEGNCPSDARPA